MHMTLGDLINRGVVTLQTGPFGSQLHKSDYVERGVPVVPTEAIGWRKLETTVMPQVSEETAARLARHRVRSGDILFARRGIQATGLSAIVEPQHEGFICGTGALRLRLNDTSCVDPTYLSFYLIMNETREWLRAHAVGAVMPNLNETVLFGIPLRIPPLPEQRAIAAVLGSLDDKIEQNRRTGRALEGLARAVFKAWFVDFEPVKAKAAGATSFPGMPPAAFAALPTRLGDSPLGPVPEGWAVGTLEDVAEAVKGLSYKGAGLVADVDPDVATALPLHNLNSVYEGGGYKNEGLKRYRGEYKDRHVLHPGDLIVANTEQGHEYRLIGFPAIVPKRYGERGLFSHHIFRVRPLATSPVKVQYLYYAMMSGRIRDEIVGCTNGTTVNMLSIDGLKRPRLCLPPCEVAQAFEERATMMYKLSESLFDESAKLAALRDYLLPRLLSGRVRVRPGKPQLAEAAEAAGTEPVGNSEGR